MAKKKNTSGRKGDPVSLAPLTPEQALAGLLKVKLADVKRMEDAGPILKKQKPKQ